MGLLDLIRSPDRFRPVDRRIVTLMFLTGVVQGFTAGLLTITLPYTRVDLGMTEGGMSLVLAVTRVGSLAALPFATWGDQRGRRRAFLAAFLLLSVAGSATSLAPGVGAFALAQSLVRAATVAVASLAAVLLAEILAPAIRAFGMSFYGAAGSIGGGVALLLLPVASREPDGWRILFAASVLGLAAYPFLHRALRESPVFRPRDRRVPLSVVIRRPHASAFWRLALITFLVTAFSSPAIGFALERVVNDLGWSAEGARLLFIATGVLGASGLFVGGRLADVWGRRPTVVVSLTLGLAGGLGIYWFAEPWVLAVSLTAAGFGSSAFVPAYTAHRSELFPTRLRATAAAWINNAGIVGSLVSFGMGFLLFDRIGVPATVTILGAGVVLSALVTLTLEETRGLELTPG